MKLLAPARVRVEKDVIVRMPRYLKGKGTINAMIGQQVSPTDIIGTSAISSGFRIIKLAENLGVTPTEVEKYLKRKLGERIYKDELLAEKKEGLLGRKKIVTAPTDGTLDFLSPETGELRITFTPKKIDLPAGVFGIVDEIGQKKGQIIIKTQVSIVHGMFGTGRVRDGILHLISKRDELVDKSFISPTFDGQILVGGSLIFRDAITSAISDEVSGIITGGINASDYKGMAGGRLIFPKKLDTDIGISIVVCEGFGSIPIGYDIYDILSAYNYKFVSIDGNAGQIFLPSFDPNCLNKVKKTTLAPIQDNQSSSYDKLNGQLLDLKLGLKVRIIGNSYAGEQGEIAALNQTATTLPSGIKTFLATIETKRHKFQVPVANLEVIDYSL